MNSHVQSTPSGLTLGQMCTERVWRDILDGIAKEMKPVTLDVPATFIDLMGKAGINELSKRCSNANGHVLEHVAPLTDGAHRLTVWSKDTAPTRCLATADAPAGKSGKAPRPPNSFILYRKHHHPRMVKKHPNAHNNQISQIIGRMWHAEPQSVKDQWSLKAKEAKDQHEKNFPGYQYQPRKPAEKKRRLKKKTNDVANNAQEVNDETAILSREIHNLLYSEPRPAETPQLSRHGNHAASFIFDPSGKDQVDLVDEMLSSMTCDQDGTPSNILGALMTAPVDHQKAQSQLYNSLNGADALETEIASMEDGLTALLEREIDSFGPSIVPHQEEEDILAPVSRFQALLDHTW